MSFTPTGWLSLSPSISVGVSFLGKMDFTNFNDQTDSSSYFYRVEEGMGQFDRVPTVRRIIIQYRDLGLATITVTVTGVNDNLAVQTASAVVTLGNAVPTNKIMTKFVDLVLTAFRPQLSIFRAAGAGPLSIVRVTMVGEIEEVTL